MRPREIATMGLAALGGGVALGAGLWYLASDLHGSRPPTAVGGLVSLAMVLGGRELGGSPWRVPRTWSRFGRVRFAGLFGAALGTGLLTAAPSAALIAFVVAVATGSGLVLGLLAFAAFAVTRIAVVAFTAAEPAPLTFARLRLPVAVALAAEPFVLATLSVSAIR
jgi:hypothetical protein